MANRVELTDREEDVLLLAGDGLTAEQIRHRLVNDQGKPLHINTVKLVVASLIRKFGVSRKNDLVPVSRKYFQSRF